MHCPNCNTSNRADARFCTNCGYQFAATCPQCHAPMVAGAKFCAQCGARLDAGAALPRNADDTILPGTMLNDRYEVRKLLGKGGFGAVYRVSDSHLSGKPLAVKEMFETDAEAQYLFKQEAELLAWLDHSRLVRVTDNFSTPAGENFLVMDFVEGDDLQQVLDETPDFLPEKRVVEWMMRACDALEYMHNWVDPRTGQKSPVIHRDVKPSNIKLRPDGEIVVIDLGIAKVKSQKTGGKTLRAARAYSPPYSPPEQYGIGTDERSDIYALGVTMYELLTKQLPPEAPYCAYEEIKPPRQFNPQISPAVAQVMLKAMDINPNRRFQSMAEMRAVLRAALDGVAPVVTAPQVSAPPPATSLKPQVITPRNAARLREIQTLQGHTAWVTSVAFSPDGAVLASGSNDKTIRLWDLAQNVQQHIFSEHKRAVTSVAFSGDGSILASGSQDRTVRLWDVYHQKELNVLEGHKKIVQSVASSPDNAVIASADSEGTILLRKMDSGNILHTLTEHELGVWSIAFSANGKMLASGSYDRTVRLWNVSTGKLLRTLTGHNNFVMGVACNQDDAVIASGDADGEVKLWHWEINREVAMLSGHEKYAMSVNFSPDGAVLVSGSCAQWENEQCREGEIKLWDVKTGQQVVALKGHKGCVMSVAFSPDGRMLASGSGDGTVKLWGVM